MILIFFRKMCVLFVEKVQCIHLWTILKFNNLFTESMVIILNYTSNHNYNFNSIVVPLWRFYKAKMCRLRTPSKKPST